MTTRPEETCQFGSSTSEARDTIGSDTGDKMFGSSISTGEIERENTSRTGIARQKFAIDTPVAPRTSRSGTGYDSTEEKPQYDMPSTDVPEVAQFPSNPELPIDASDRKKAYKSAIYYSECYMKGVKPSDADDAAKDVKGTYRKWWVESNFHEISHSPRDASHTSGLRLANQLQHVTGKSHSGGLKRSREQNDTEQRSLARPRKHRRRRGGLRDVIDAVTIHGHDSETQSHCGVVTLSSSEQPIEDITSCEEDFASRERIQLNRMVSSDSSVDESPFGSCVLSTSMIVHQMKVVRSQLIEELKVTGGDTEGASFLEKLEKLTSFYKSSGCDARLQTSPLELDGNWFTLSKPTYFDCRGRNGKGNYLYTLGRMAFDMFRPTNVICSIQGIFNTVHSVSDSSYASISVPRTLQRNVRANISMNGMVGLRTYNIVVAFTTEPSSTENSEFEGPSRPIRGIMTNYGYFLPDPEVPNRLSVWFTGGSLEVNDEEHDMDEWKRLFHHDRVPKRDMREYARVLATKILLGAHVPETMDDDGTMHYWLKRPIGGHGRAFCDVIYLDESLRIMRGHQGSIFVFSRVSS